ncbi:MAG TPA: type II glyceraldehyde-3-phosphate dehydrogenase [Candidatus Nanoarchaeia archaeon]|nr:type II glyceraldehyde-3-phosphate dehydrogenase [Candidatus Nanoarchaeia archaeon]
MDRIKVALNGFGTIGKRVADAVRLQKDMELIGITGHSYNFRMEAANDRGIPIYTFNGENDFKANGITPAGKVDQLFQEADIIVDATPKKVGKDNKEKYYVPMKKKAIFQGGEKAATAEVSFVAQCNFKEAVNKNYVRVVSCNTTGLCRALKAVDDLYGLELVHATMVRRGADPGDIDHGPINAIVPVLELPSHHGPDVQTVLHNVNIFTTAMSVSTTLMHCHSIHAECKKTPDVAELVKRFKETTRIRMVRTAEQVNSTAEIIELARDMGRIRGDMPELCLWEEAVGVVGKNLFYLQAVHQESIVVPENIDAIRAAMGFTDAQKSIDTTNKSIGIR